MGQRVKDLWELGAPFLHASPLLEIREAGGIPVHRGSEENGLVQLSQCSQHPGKVVGGSSASRALA